MLGGGPRNDVARCLCELTLVTLASGYGSIGLRTVQVEHNSSVASFLAAHHACRVLSVYRHYDHHGEPNTKRASHPQVLSEDEGVDPTRRLRDFILRSENLLEYAQLGHRTLAEGYHGDCDRPDMRDA